jgi:RNA polymerase sigma-70 factor (ECF subfamily)
MRDDPSAWPELVAAWERKMLYYISRLVPRHHDAYDILQQVWFAAYRGIGRLDDPRDFSPWIYRIARNKAIDHRQLRLLKTTDAADDLPTSDDHAQDRFDNAEALHLALDRLSIAHREVLTLYFLEDFSVDQIARVLEVPPGTVKSRLHHAKRDLRQLLENQENP